MTSRIKPIDLPLSDEMQNIMNMIFPKELPSPILYRTVARNKDLFKDMVNQKLIGFTGLFDRKSLPPKLREILILRTSIASRNYYEFNLHVQTISEHMGLNSNQIKDIEKLKPNKDMWDKNELALMLYIDSLVKYIEVSDDMFYYMKNFYDEPALIEITLLIGLYTSVAMIATLAKPELDDYTKHFNK